MSLTVPHTAHATAIAKDAAGKNIAVDSVAWSTADEAIAKISASGVITAVDAGDAIIRASVHGSTGSASLTIARTTAIGTSAVATVSVTLGVSSLTPGQTTLATAVPMDSVGHVVSGKTVTWSSLDSTIARVSSSGVVTAITTGATQIRATVDATSGTAPITSSSSPLSNPGASIATPAALPAIYVNTTYPTFSGTVRNVGADEDLQAAINAAQPGDQIVLAPGATYKGNYVLPAKACTGYVVIRSGGLESDYPAAGQRITPTYAPKLAKIVTPNVSPALLAKNGACKWWISRVEITAVAQSSTVNYNYGLVVFGQGETSLSALPTDLVLDRVYVHGAPSLSTQRAIAFNSGSAAVVDSWVSDIHWPGSDTQAVAGWAGPGPYKIVNNYLDAASENILFGGADPVIANVSPSDIEIRQNHITKPLSYRGAGFTVKNLIELKHAKRVLIDGNVMENSWADGQIGWAMIFQSLTDNPAAAPWTETCDVTLQHNIIRNANGGLILLAHGYNGSGIAMSRVTVRDNLFQNIGGDQLSIGIQLISNLTDILVEHNTIVRNTTQMGTPVSLDGTGAARIDLRNNVVGPAAPYDAVFKGGGLLGSAALTDYASAAWSYAGNLGFQLQSYFSASNYPPNNYWVATQADVGFAADWSLLSTSPFKAKATDGKDPGADIAGMQSLTASVVAP